MGYEQKVAALCAAVEACRTPEAVYAFIVALGKKARRFTEAEKQDERMVVGCQSPTYVLTTEQSGLFFFEIDSAALISAGLGQLLVQVYSGEPLESILQRAPTYLEERGILQGLSLARAMGVQSMFAQMQRDALLLVHSSTG